MDNRINVLRRKMKALRAEMLEVEDAIRDQITQDQDCTQDATRLMGMRRELTVLVREWGAMGGISRLPTVDERLRERYQRIARPPIKVQPKQKVQKRRLVAQR